MPSSRGSSQPRNRTCIFCIGRQILYQEATGEGPLDSYPYWIIISQRERKKRYEDLPLLLLLAKGTKWALESSVWFSSAHQNKTSHRSNDDRATWFLTLCETLLQEWRGVVIVRNSWAGPPMSRITTNDLNTIAQNEQFYIKKKQIGHCLLLNWNSIPNSKCEHGCCWIL